jgi:hypothetical protein
MEDLNPTDPKVLREQFKLARKLGGYDTSSMVPLGSIGHETDEKDCKSGDVGESPQIQGRKPVHMGWETEPDEDPTKVYDEDEEDVQDRQEAQYGDENEDGELMQEEEEDEGLGEASARHLKARMQKQQGHDQDDKIGANHINTRDSRDPGLDFNYEYNDKEAQSKLLQKPAQIETMPHNTLSLHCLEDGLQGRPDLGLNM